MSTYRGDTLTINVYGSSHAPEIGAYIEGIPAGQRINLTDLKELMARRMPGGAYATKRKEPDEVEFISGVIATDSNLLTTTGGTIQLRILNTDTRSGDYAKTESIPRPGHADLAEYFRTGAYIEPGGGAHSGRMTAPLLAAGGIILQILEVQGVTIVSALESIGTVAVDEALTAPSEEMLAQIAEVRSEQDSVGGVIEVRIKGLASGVGGPLFDGLESHFARLVFSIPAVKSFEVGFGKDLSYLKGSESNDEIALDEAGNPTTVTNKQGGLLGGISFGQDIILHVGMKPTPSISQAQKSIDLKTNKPTELTIVGRHDPCVALRVMPVLEAVVGIALYDQIRKRES